MKAATAAKVKKFQDIPNVGPAIEKSLRMIGIKTPKELIGKDPFLLYKKMCKVMNQRQDPCVLDTFIAAVDFMNGAAARPWWSYTKTRKIEYPNV